MENKICPLRMLQNNNTAITGENYEELSPHFKCFGEKCAWFLKNHSGGFDLSECAVMSLVAIQDIVR